MTYDEELDLEEVREKVLVPVKRQEAIEEKEKKQNPDENVRTIPLRWIVH